jgi:hypothetical protein
MRDDDESEHRADDESGPRPVDGAARAQQAPVIRLLANPRRTRRA